ncbi:DUF4132 domain-containing protein [Umezawaea sp. Da 62-37]|uniref:DUF4132 domain-containing protein n=1 Tax=Umezawaea sp. Da 62-37 TaxID=3075927 RepID=UPI0028F6DD9F|nr:DUF4132 domain-containing protein [Umezawaea sp. Da 62-37]WNV90541.1 DUF4132 domain-containing protein [Umezawaea sp. Da 62-37]
MSGHANRARGALAVEDADGLVDAAMASHKAGHNFVGTVWSDVLDRLRALPEDARVRVVRGLADRYRAAPEQGGPILPLVAVASSGTSAEDVLVAERRAALDGLAGQYGAWGPDARLLAEAELAAGRGLEPRVVALLRRLGLESYQTAETVAFAKRLTEPVLNVGEAWADRAMADLASLPEPWRRLLALAATATTAKPNAKWEQPARALVAEIGEEAVRDAVLSWLALVGRPRTFPLERRTYDYDVTNAYDPYNANAVRGLTWFLALLPAHPRSARVLGALVETSLRKVDGLGPRNPKVANAAVGALARLDGEAVLAELARLATRLTHKGTLKLVDAALEAKAVELGLRREEIEELAVPAYGLTGVGRSTTVLGETTAEITVVGGTAVLGWRSAAGKPVKSPPAAVRRDHAEELKELKATAKDIDRMLTAQVERLDRQFLARRTWAYAVWRERYLDHPLVGTIARRLLWTVDGVACAFTDGELRDLAGDPVTGAEVALWHPIGHPTAEVLAWRERLEEHGVTQPFKQAHREVYLLTDAERRTGAYSNRFAAHVLRQHQFHSLAAVRGWRNKLRLAVDDTYEPAVRDLPLWGLRAEFWIEGDGEEYGVDTAPSGSYLRLRTDQVRFYPIDAAPNHAHASGGGYAPVRGRQAEPLALTEVPDLVLSEVLRDVDLFVGVASVGNDPTWQDGGPDGRFTAYWHSYGFGELTQTAQTRRDLLTRLVPRLAIGGQCTVEDRFLRVKGARHTYKIHLGSGNIMIAPDNRYLCIVPKPSAGTDSYLPFDGDRTLAVILSKAMLLAKDTDITDPTILSQL